MTGKEKRSGNTPSAYSPRFHGVSRGGRGGYSGMAALLVQVLGALALLTAAASEKRSSCGEEVYVTLTTSDMSAQGALVLRSALSEVKASHCVVVMVTKDVSPVIRSVLERLFDEVVTVDPDLADVIAVGGASQGEEGVARENPAHMLAKLSVWTLTRFRKVVFLDSDTLVLRNPDSLFDLEELAAAAEGTWPDWFQSGVMVLIPSLDTHSRLLEIARTAPAIEATNQGVLNTAFPLWHRLPCVYNTPSNLPDINRPAYLRFKDKVVVARFGKHKPWFLAFNSDLGTPEVRLDMVGWMPLPLPFYDTWWRLYAKHVLPAMEKSLREYNMTLVRQGPRVILGNEETGLHVEAGFYVWDNKSYPKMLWVRGREISNEVCGISDQLLSPKTRIGVQG